MDNKQQNFYKRLLINILVKCLKQGIKKLDFCLKQGRKISNICLKQGQGMRDHAAPAHPGIYRVPPPPPPRDQSKAVRDAKSAVVTILLLKTYQIWFLCCHLSCSFKIFINVCLYVEANSKEICDKISFLLFSEKC